MICQMYQLGRQYQLFIEKDVNTVAWIVWFSWAAGLSAVLLFLLVFRIQITSRVSHAIPPDHKDVALLLKCL